jgi:PPOX class probable F420-dependent enzyme
MIDIPENLQYLVDDRTKAFAMLGTVMKDGTPQVTPVWFNYKDGFILINSAKGRVKDENMRRSPRVAVTILDPNNSYTYLQIRGKVVEITEDGAEEHINFLAYKYRGTPYKMLPGMVRVIYTIEPERITGSVD